MIKRINLVSAITAFNQTWIIETFHPTFFSPHIHPRTY
jgi:hypothetical protein